MIKVNLLPQRRAKRSQASEGGQREMALGIGVLVVLGALTVFAVDQPKRSQLRSIRASNDQLQQEIDAKNRQLVDYPKLKAAADEAKERTRAIDRLIAAKVVPANVLHELGEILTTGHDPTMTANMARRVKTTDPNRGFDPAWDPNHVWLTSFSDKGNTFRLDGGAQAENDITQLSKRLQASAYFDDISPSEEQRVTDRDTGVAYYQFTITGKVAY